MCEQRGVLTRIEQKRRQTCLRIENHMHPTAQDKMEQGSKGIVRQSDKSGTDDKQRTHSTQKRTSGHNQHNITDPYYHRGPVNTVPSLAQEMASGNNTSSRDPSNVGSGETNHEDGALVEEETVIQDICSEYVPKVGMTFQSEQEAYDFYNSYAERIGFSIRKSHSKLRKDCSVFCKVFCCSRQGKSAANPNRVTRKPRGGGRTDCLARIQFFINRDGVWKTQRVELQHNHDLIPGQVHVLRSQRNRHILNAMRKAGIKTSHMFDFCQQMAAGSEKPVFSRMKRSNSLSSQREKLLQASDAQMLLEYLKNKQSEDPSFFYAVQVDGTGQIANFFWTDGRAMTDYAYFGDVVLLDTMFETSKFELPFAPLLGVNHHKHTIVFGAALLFDQTVESFVWLFETFLTAMSEKQPTTILADQSTAISNAIGMVLPSTINRPCLRHICHNAGRNLSHVVSSSPKFLHDFKECVYEGQSVEHFNSKWNELIRSYNLAGNLWIDNLYSLSEKWAIVYHRDYFCAGMTTYERSESMNNQFMKFFRLKLSLPEFVEEYSKCINRLREKEVTEDNESRHTKPIPSIPNMPMLKTAAELYTKNVYFDFEEEFKKQFTNSCTFMCQVDTMCTYRVVPMETGNEGVVMFNSEDSTVHCSCRLYESAGILCMHALRVLNHNNIFVLPSQYILRRWTRYAKDGLPFPGCTSDRQTDNETIESCYVRVSRKLQALAFKCCVSKEALQYLERGLDKLASESDAFLHGVDDG